MESQNQDDPYRRPTTGIETEQPDETPVARTPGFLEMVLILTGSAFVGGVTFFATCLGTILRLSFLQKAVPAALRRHPLMIVMPLAVFLISTATSGYVAYLTGRSIYRWFGRPQSKPE